MISLAPAMAAIAPAARFPAGPPAGAVVGPLPERLDAERA